MTCEEPIRFRASNQPPSDLGACRYRAKAAEILQVRLLTARNGRHSVLLLIRSSKGRFERKTTSSLTWDTATGAARALLSRSARNRSSVWRLALS